MIVTTISCNNENWILFRASSDYFPLQKGNKWYYQTSGMTKIIEVKNDTVINNTSAIIITNNFQNEYWQKKQGDVKKLSLRQINYGGNDYILQQSWLLQYQLPFIIGSTWSDVFSDTVAIFGDSYYIKEMVTRKVVAIEDVDIPAGSFFHTYRIDFAETFSLNDSIAEYLGSEWFAPEVGLIKRITDNNEQVLIEYLINK